MKCKPTPERGGGEKGGEREGEGGSERSGEKEKAGGERGRGETGRVGEGGTVWPVVICQNPNLPLLQNSAPFPLSPTTSLLPPDIISSVREGRKFLSESVLHVYTL